MYHDSGDVYTPIHPYQLALFNKQHDNVKGHPTANIEIHQLQKLSSVWLIQLQMLCKSYDQWIGHL